MNETKAWLIESEEHMYNRVLTISNPQTYAMNDKNVISS